MAQASAITIRRNPQIPNPSRRRIAPVVEPVHLPLLDPVGFPDGMVQGGRTRTAACKVGGTSGLPCDKVEFWFRRKQEEGACVLYATHLEKDDPYGQRPIEFDPDVMCTHRNLVFLRLHGAGSGSPPGFFAYSFSFLREEQDTVVMLPKTVPEIWSSQSFALLRDEKDSKRYVVVNLQLQSNRKEAILHRWLSSSSSWLPVRVTLPFNINVTNWQTDQVMPFLGALLWIDLNQGILCCSNPFNPTKLDCIRLPGKLPSKRSKKLMCVGCCDGDLKFVYLKISDANTLVVTIMIRSKFKYKYKSQYEWQFSADIVLNCTYLWDDMKKIMPQPSPGSELHDLFQLHWGCSGNHMPCLPVLKDDALFLTIANKDEKHAWLLQVDMNSGVLVAANAYPGFFSHRKPPYPIDASVYRDCFPASVH